MTSVTEQLAQWIVGAGVDDLPVIGVQRVKERVLDSIGCQLAGASTPTGRNLAAWVQTQGAAGASTVVGRDFRTSASYAALVNATAGHALDFDDSATFSSHPSNPLTAAVLALGEKLGSSGSDAVLAFLVGWEVICQTNKPCAHPLGNTLLQKSWHNQGFQPALGVAAAAAKLLGLDVSQTRMALGHAASTMGGLHKNCGSDTKPFHAGNPAMHGLMAAELVLHGFTANEDILDGERGVARLLGGEVGEAEKVLDGLGTWDLATNGSWIKIYACNGGGQFAQAAMRNLLDRRPFRHDEVEAIEVHINSFLMSELPYHLPQTGLEAKFSVEYDIAAIVIDGRAGLHQYTDEMVRRPEAQALMRRVTPVLHEGEVRRGHLHTTVVVTLRDGTRLEETENRVQGQPERPLTEAEITEKFDDCAADVIANRRARIAELCWRLESVRDVGELAALLGASDGREDG